MGSFRLLLLLATATARLPILDEKSPTRVENEFIVIFKEDATDAVRSKHMSMVKAHIAETNGAKLLYEYDIVGDKVFRGYAVKAPKESAALEFARAADDHVAFVEQNKVVKIPESEMPSRMHSGSTTKRKPMRLVKEEAVAALSDECAVENESTWGIVRTANEENKKNGIYSYGKGDEGEETYAYIVDTGIYLDHSEFEGRAIWGIDVENPNDSCKCDSHGHGTHVAGTIMGKNYGIAKKATAVAIRVLDDEGYGTDAGVIEGIEWAHDDAQGKQGVVNMSLGGGYSLALNNAIGAAVSGGLPVISASGNEAQDACNTSPASAEDAITVNASNFDDVFCDFSNYGTCTDIIAPGEDITSAWITGPYSLAIASGTSMACPHVVGVVCKMLSRNGPMSPSDVRSALLSMGTDGIITSITRPWRTPNVLLHMECDSEEVDD